MWRLPSTQRHSGIQALGGARSRAASDDGGVAESLDAHACPHPVGRRPVRRGAGPRRKASDRRDSNARAVREDSGVQASARRRTHRHWSLGLQPDAMYCTRSSLVRMLTSCAAAARTARRPARRGADRRVNGDPRVPLGAPNRATCVATLAITALLVYERRQR